MIKISKGGRVLEVTSGAYKAIYKATGWSPVDKTPAAASQKPAVDVSGEGGSNSIPEGREASTELQEAHTGEETLNKMSDDELKQYASLLGIQTKDLKGRKKLMEAIKAHQK